MVSNKAIEKQDNSSVKLTITVSKEEAKKEYDALIKKYASSVQIKGFRKGKVPTAVLERKFGEGLRAEAAGNVVDASLKEVFEDDEFKEKPLAYASPELADGEDLELALGEDFTFSVIYDVFPEITLGEYKGLKIEETQVSILKADEESELKTYQEQNAIVVDKKDKKVAKDNIVTIDYCEVDDEDNDMESTKRQDFVFTVGTGYNIYKIDDDIIGMKLGEEKVIEKDYPEDFESAELAGQKKKIKVSITAVKRKELPKLDDELAQDISDKFETLDDLRKDVREKLEKNAADKVKGQNLEQVFDQLLETSSLDIPASMLNGELESAWYRFVQQSRMPEESLLGFLQAEGKDKAAVQEEWKPDVIKNTKIKLLLGKILEIEKIEASEEDLEAEIAEQAELGGMSVEDTKKYLEENRMNDYLKEQIIDRKVREFLIEQADKKKGSKVKYLEFMNKQ